MLRRIAFKTLKGDDDSRTIWNASSASTQQQIKSILLDGYEKEAQVAVRNKICDTIADVARECDEQNRMYFLWCEVDGSEPWQELLGALFQSTKSPEPAHRESAFRVFAALPTLVDKEHSEVLKTVFLGGLQDQNPKVSL